MCYSDLYLCRNAPNSHTCSLVHQGAAAVHFQDFNAEVLQCLTIPNVNANLLQTCEAEIRYFAGDWGEVHQLLSHSNTDKSCSSELDKSGGYDIILMAETVYSISALPNLYQLIKKVTLSTFVNMLLIHVHCGV